MGHKIYFHVPKKYTFGLFIILAAHIGGVGVGAAMGILMGLVLTMGDRSRSSPHSRTWSMRPDGRHLQELGKSFTGLTFLLSNAFMAFYVSGSSITILSFREILVSTGLLMAIPNRFLDLLRQFVDYSLMRYKEQKVLYKQDAGADRGTAQ